MALSSFADLAVVRPSCLLHLLMFPVRVLPSQIRMSSSSDTREHFVSIGCLLTKFGFAGEYGVHEQLLTARIVVACRLNTLSTSVVGIQTIQSQSSL